MYGISSTNCMLGWIFWVARKGVTVRIVDPGHGTNTSAGVLLHTPFNIYSGCSCLAKVTSWSPKLISGLISAKSEQCLAAALSSTDFNHHVLAVIFTLCMGLISHCIYPMFYYSIFYILYSMFYSYRTKLLSY